MTRNEVFFALGDGDSEPELIDVPPAPSAPSHGMAEIIQDVPVAVDVPETNVVTPEVQAVHQMRMLGEPYKKARRFHADVPAVMGLLLFLITAIASASFYVSFSGLYVAAAWAVGDAPTLQIAAPLMLDLSILAYSLSLFIKRERGESVWGTWLAISIFASISATANVLHTFAVSTATTPSELFIGATISGGAPILLAFATETIAKLVFSPIKNK